MKCPELCFKQLSLVTLTSLNFLHRLRGVFSPPGYFHPTSFKTQRLFPSRNERASHLNLGSTLQVRLRRAPRLPHLAHYDFVPFYK